MGRGETRKIRYFTHQVCAVGRASAVGAEEICIGGESSEILQEAAEEDPVMN